MATNRPRGRPRLHSDRWLALFCLFYRLAEWLAVQDSEIAKWKREDWNQYLELNQKAADYYRDLAKITKIKSDKERATLELMYHLAVCNPNDAFAEFKEQIDLAVLYYDIDFTF